MGQKTNPTLLRLEKTNQHYKATWFSDRFYAEQLHQNYKSLNYLDKTFYKVKKAKTINYIKAGYNFNQLFCLLPKKRQKRFKFGKSKFYVSRTTDMKNSTTNKGLLNQFYLFYILPYKGSLINNNYTDNIAAPMPSALPKVIQSLITVPDGKIKQVSQLENNLKRKTPVNFVSWYKQHNKHKQELCNTTQNKTRQLTRNSYFLSRLNKFYEKNKVASISKLSISLLYNQLNTTPNYLDITEQINQVKKHHRVRMERVLESSSYFTFIKQNLLDLEIINKVNNQKTNIIKQDNKLSKLQWLHHISSFRNNQFPYSHKATSIYFVKISHLQQSSQFLAQKIMVGLSNRINFPRLRKQILWDVTKSKFVKGIRVTLSGRVESKSKKAQKARDRTFQWGQTELHVLSSLVNFTQSNLVTPFGKIGIKVWVCYGI